MCKKIQLFYICKILHNLLCKTYHICICKNISNGSWSESQNFFLGTGSLRLHAGANAHTVWKKPPGCVSRLQKPRAASAARVCRLSGTSAKNSSSGAEKYILLARETSGFTQGLRPQSQEKTCINRWLLVLKPESPDSRALNKPCQKFLFWRRKMHSFWHGKPPASRRGSAHTARIKKHASDGCYFLQPQAACPPGEIPAV